jgi:hypothetical protein
MKIHRTLCSVLLLGMNVFCATARGQTQDCIPGKSPGAWSAKAADLCTTVSDSAPDATRDILIYSPSRKTAVHVVKEAWWVEVGAKRLDFNSGKAYVGYPAELAWSSDGKFFYITWSEGNIDGWVTEVYEVGADQIHKITDIGSPIQKDFDQQHACVSTNARGEKEQYEPNIGGVAWLPDSKRLLVAAEAIPDSRCGDRSGQFAGYLVSIPDGAILERFGPKDLVEKWRAQLGARLKGNYADMTLTERTARP